MIILWFFLSADENIHSTVCYLYGKRCHWDAVRLNCRQINENGSIWREDCARVFSLKPFSCNALFLSIYSLELKDGTRTFEVKNLGISEIFYRN